MKNDDLLKKTLYDRFPGDYAKEVSGFYQELVTLGYGANCTEGQVAFMQLYYEIDNFCTSIVAQHSNGTIFHGRNLDYSLPGLENITANVKWVKGGEELAFSTQYIGYMGILTGMRPNGWAVSVNQRFSVEVPEVNMIDTWLNGARSIGFFLRDTLLTVDSYEEMLPLLENIWMDEPVYLTVSGTKAGQGAVLTRNRNGTDESDNRGVWSLSPSEDIWYRLETNFDSKQHLFIEQNYREERGYSKNNFVFLPTLLVKQIGRY
jgi:N-acylethanolamine-hydrolysing acid amidase